MTVTLNLDDLTQKGTFNSLISPRSLILKLEICKLNYKYSNLKSTPSTKHRSCKELFLSQTRLGGYHIENFKYGARDKGCPRKRVRFLLASVLLHPPNPQFFALNSTPCHPGYKVVKLDSWAGLGLQNTKLYVRTSESLVLVMDGLEQLSDWSVVKPKLVHKRVQIVT